MDKEELINKINENYSVKDLSLVFNKSTGSIKYWLRKYKLRTHGYKKTHSWNKNELLLAIQNSECKSDVLRFLNIKIKSGNFQTLDRYCLKYNIDISQLKYKNNRGNKFQRKIRNEDIFIKNSLTSRNTVKKRIISDNLLPYECVLCGQDENWNGIKISLILDHKNGINNDHSFENLRFVCPNCNAGLPTHCKGNVGLLQIEKRNLNKQRNKINTYIKQRKVKRPSYIQLIDEIEELGYVGTGKKYGVSDNAIRKWVKFYKNNGAVAQLVEHRTENP